MAFNSLLKALNRTFRNLHEMILLNLFARQKLRSIAASELPSISFRLPFYGEQSTALGIVMKHFAANLSHDSVKLSASFPTLRNVQEELRRGCAFWDAFFKSVVLLFNEKQISGETYNEFVSANKYLDQKRKLLHAH